MQKLHVRRLGVVLVGLCLSASRVWAGAPVVGVDVGASIPTSKFKQSADLGGTIAPFVGYQFGDSVAFTPLAQVGYSVFGSADCPPDTDCGPDDDVTDLLSLGGGARLSLRDGNAEIFFTGLGNWYKNFQGRLDNDNAAGFAVAGGLNYDFGFLPPGMSLGAFARYDQSSIDASQRAGDDLTFVTLGLTLRHRFLPPPVAPAVAPVVAQAPPPPMKKKIILRGVNFDFDKSTLRPDGRPILDEAVRVLKEEPSIRVSVEGHTDAVGTDTYNQGLSQRRAATVRGYLVEHGIDAGRLSAVGFGESKPVASNDTADGRAQNRRVELVVQE